MPVKTGRGTLHYGSKPVKGHREHYDPKVGDTRWSIEHTAHQPAGPDKIKQQDFNTTLLWLTLVPRDASSEYLVELLHLEWDGKNRKRVLVSIGGHWETVGGNGFTHWVDDKHKAHHFTKDQLRVRAGLTIQEFVDNHGGTFHTLHKLRRPVSGDYPLLWVEAIRIADGLGVVLVSETKHPSYAGDLGAATITEPCRIYDYPCWPMTLITMAKALEKFLAFRHRKVPLMIIMGRKMTAARRASYKRKIKTTWPAQPTYW